jgi:murein DD-endopeptidase MepM/ murein hydrolase activator NlpD
MARLHLLRGRPFLVVLSAATITIASLANNATAQQAPSTIRTLQVNIEARTEFTRFVPADDGESYLVYDLFVTNWTDHALTLARLDVEDAKSSKVLMSYDKAALEDPDRQRSTRYVETKPSEANRILGAGRTSWVKIGLSLEPNQAAPTLLRHRVVFESDPSQEVIADDGTRSSALVSVSAPSSISNGELPILQPPLRGGPWRCANGLGLGNAHSSLYASGDAKMRVPQRYGCDFFKVDPEGNILPNPFPDQITPGMFYSYGAEVLAVADGVIEAAHDGVPEGVPQADGSIVMPVPLTDATVAGNWIALNMGNGKRAFYAHLQPGSLRVKAGDRVHAGQVLGLLGMAGNASGPHLHFQVGDASALNGSNGVPYVFAHYQFVGRGKPGDPKRNRQVHNAVPLDGSLLVFP